MMLLAHSSDQWTSPHEDVDAASGKTERLAKQVPRQRSNNRLPAACCHGDRLCPSPLRALSIPVSTVRNRRMLCLRYCIAM